MSDTKVSEQHSADAKEINSALFAHLVVQQANMAMMMMGKTAHPETGQSMHDLEAAKLFIDMLQMLEAKTKGNLDQREETMLKQTLMTVRMAFVEAANAPKEKETPAAQGDTSPAATSEPVLEKGSAAAEESHKKFSKKSSPVPGKATWWATA